MSATRIDVLAFGAHPDDVELFCGGILIRLADLGHHAAVVDLSRGERASRGTPEEREREAEAAAGVMGLAHRENLRLPDTGIDASSASQVATVVEAIRRLRPGILLIPWIEERHPDHVEAARLLERAAFLAGIRKVETDPPSERFVPDQVLYYAMRHRMRPSFVVDTSAAAERKAAAIACHASQVAMRPDEPATLIGSELALAAIDARDRYHGSMIGTSHGEPLRSAKVPGLVDPVKHFRDNPFSEAHAFESLL